MMSPIQSSIIRKGEYGYPYLPSEEAKVFFRKLKNGGVLLFPSNNVAHGSIIEPGKWRIVVQYKNAVKGAEWKFSHEVTSSEEPFHPESNEEYRTIYELID